MTNKVYCKVTGNVIYMTAKRYARVLAKYGGEEALKANYVSMVGKKIISGERDEVNEFKNRIRCISTDQWCYITDERIQAGIKKHGSWDALKVVYMSRPARRLFKAGKTIDEIKAMVADGTFEEKAKQAKNKLPCE